ncbi:MAG: SDR family oxidoreductase [Rhodoferax sp.]|jgi:NAD(P)-dependent dehydrogenase (short-subunit alcohol dehydrogenase family)|nr:SDR family oxidoreductase [Rhodoferax sp.]
MAMNNHDTPPVAFAGVQFHSLRGRSVLVTGGASGIGADIVRAFAGQGCQVGFLDRDTAAGEALAASLPQVHFRACDVTDVPAMQAALAALQVAIGGVDVLVNNVAHDERHSIESVTPAYFDERVAINLRPHFFATQAVLSSMRARGGGAIVNMGSASWKIKGSGYAVYATCKSSMLGFTRVLARELGPDNIRVNCVVPGWVMTERQRALWLDEAGERAMDQNHCIPGRIVGQDIAHMVLFLAADTARMVTAAEFVVDAGWS